MKVFLVILIFLVTFGACSRHDAFNRFEISKERALSEESIQSSKISNNKKIDGAVTAVYLNKVDPKVYKDAEYFYIYLCRDDQSYEIKFTLNGTPATSVEKLKSNNIYTQLTLSDVEWQEYYLVQFAKSGNTLNLKVKDNNSASSVLRFKKN